VEQVFFKKFWFKPSKQQEKYQFQAKMINIFEILKDISSKLLRFDCLGKKTKIENNILRDLAKNKQKM
jgi:hypothetical protein